MEGEITFEFDPELEAEIELSLLLAELDAANES